MVQQQLARGELVADQEGRLNVLGKARGHQEDPNVYLPQNPLSHLALQTYHLALIIPHVLNCYSKRLSF